MSKRGCDRVDTGEVAAGYRLTCLKVLGRTNVVSWMDLGSSCRNLWRIRCRLESEE